MRKLKEILADCAVILGAAAVALGAGAIYAPAGLIIFGIELIALTVLAWQNGGEEG